MLLTKISFVLCFVIKFSISSLVTEKNTQPTLPCVTDKDCSANNTLCLNKNCQCDHGYIFSGDRTKCLQVVTSYGAACEESQQCSEYLFVGGSCEQRFCSCASGYHYLHGRCWKSSSIGGKCLSSNDCYVNFDVGAAECYNNNCKCSGGYYQREYRSCRRRAPGEGDDCAIDLDCQFDTIKNITCNKLKKCFIEISKTSLIKSSSASRELMDIDSEYKVIKGINSDTTSNPNDKLICQRGHFYSEQKKKCVAEIGEPCRINEEPLIKNSICQGNNWKCKAAFVPTLNNRFCKKATTEYNKSCLFNEQCYIFGPDAVCNRMQRCVCNSKSHFIHEELFCWGNKVPGDSCQVHYDCYDDGLQINSQCINNTCTCPIGYHTNSKNICARDVEVLGDECSESADCKSLPNTNCISGVCSCVQNYYAELGKCVPGVNTPCNNSAICQPDNSYCEGGICKCVDEYVIQSPGECVPLAVHGDNCSYTVQCMTVDPHSYCPMGKRVCSCLDTYHYNYGQCYKRKVLGERCDNIAECYVRSHPSTVVCENGVCQCNAMRKVDDTYCGNYGTTILFSTWTLSTITVLKLII